MAPSDPIEIINDVVKDQVAEVPVVDVKNNSAGPVEAALVTDTPIEEENKDGVNTDDTKPGEEASKPEAQPEEKAEHESPSEDAGKVTIDSDVVESSESCKPSVVVESDESCKPEDQVGQKVETAIDASAEDAVKAESTVVASGESATTSNGEEGNLDKAQTDDAGKTDSKPEEIPKTKSADKMLEVVSDASSVDTPACKSPNEEPMDTSNDTDAPMNKTLKCKAKEASPDEPEAKKTKQLSEGADGAAQIADAIPECLVEIAAQ